MLAIFCVNSSENAATVNCGSDSIAVRIVVEVSCDGILVCVVMYVTVLNISLN